MILPDGYSTTYSFDIVEGIDKSSVTLPYSMIETTHYCGVKKIELAENPDFIILSAEAEVCPNAEKCDVVDI